MLLDVCFWRFFVFLVCFLLFFFCTFLSESRRGQNRFSQLVAEGDHHELWQWWRSGFDRRFGRFSMTVTMSCMNLVSDSDNGHTPSTGRGRNRPQRGWWWRWAVWTLFLTEITCMNLVSDSDNGRTPSTEKGRNRPQREARNAPRGHFERARQYKLKIN